MDHHKAMIHITRRHPVTRSLLLSLAVTASVWGGHAFAVTDPLAQDFTPAERLVAEISDESGSDPWFDDSRLASLVFPFGSASDESAHS